MIIERIDLHATGGLEVTSSGMGVASLRLFEPFFVGSGSGVLKMSLFHAISGMEAILFPVFVVSGGRLSYGLLWLESKSLVVGILSGVSVLLWCGMPIYRHIKYSKFSLIS